MYLECIPDVPLDVSTPFALAHLHRITRFVSTCKFAPRSLSIPGFIDWEHVEEAEATATCIMLT